MIEYLAPLALGAAALIPQREYSDRKKIDQVFANIKFAVRAPSGAILRPKYMKRKSQSDDRTRYDYRLPLGLVATDKLRDIMESSLGKVVEIKGEQFISIYVYEKRVPNVFPYKDMGNRGEDAGKWAAPVGMSHKGTVWHNFDHTPHMTVAGTTRFGKTVFLKSLMTNLIEHNPDDVRFFIIDLKGGLEFERYRSLKQVEGVACDAKQASGMLTNILEEIQDTMEDFKAKRITNIVESDVKQRTFIIVDEGAQLAPERSMSPERKKLLGFCQGALSEVTRIAGAVGYRLIFCTQYPTADTLPRQIKQNSDAKISFRLPSDYASEVAIDSTGAEQLERKGQAIYKTHEKVTIQAPLITDEEVWERIDKYEEEVVEDEQTDATETKGGANTVKIG